MNVKNAQLQVNQQQNKPVIDSGFVWRTKSLNSKSVQHYELDLNLKNEIADIITDKKMITKGLSIFNQKQSKKKSEEKVDETLLCAPKVKQINDKTFCIILQNRINLFYLLEALQRARMKIPVTFGKLSYEVTQKIEFLQGNNCNKFYIGTANSLIILEIYQKQDKFCIRQLQRKSIPNLISLAFVKDFTLILSRQYIFLYQNYNFKLKNSSKLIFQNQQDKLLFQKLKTVGLVVHNLRCMYYFGTKIDSKPNTNTKRTIHLNDPHPVKDCQTLFIVKFKLQTNNSENQNSKGNLTQSQIQEQNHKITQTKVMLNPIDHIFQIGIFTRSKIYQIDEEVFLMSLYQQIILIKPNFNRFIVWDNVSIISSKSQQKKGQLILADKRVLVYSQNTEIFAHDIHFDEVQSKLKMPPIDSFKGNESDGQVLYDAVSLQYDQQSLMKVLVYFKQNEVVLPNKSKYRRLDEETQKLIDHNKLIVGLICIKQTNPQDKLMQLISQGKQDQDINLFCQRFSISSLDKAKCKWSVSSKTLKDIEGILLEISDDKYIQTQLDNILKKQPHTLNFLISVEKKQIARLKKILVKKLLNQYEEDLDKISITTKRPIHDNREVEKLQKIIKWLMESIMFEKKLDYSRNFLAFKEYDFIEIGKLKAASLKEEIKLLSCKKYDKRLKYFLNSFKILAIANFEEIFRFLLANKSEKQVQQFIRSFPFILPKFEEESEVFLNKQHFNIYQKKHRNRFQSFQVPDFDLPEISGKQICNLWEDFSDFDEIVGRIVKDATTEQLEENRSNLQTVENFQKMIVEQIKQSDTKIQSFKDEAILKFRKILANFIQGNWFINYAFKLHSMLSKTSHQLIIEFKQLKRKGVYKILLKYLFEKIEHREFEQSKVNQLLQNLMQAGLLPESFKRNDDARLKVFYQIIEKTKITTMSKTDLPYKPQYLIWSQPKYFAYLFSQSRSLILKSVKPIYDQIEIGFFRQCFRIYLNSSMVNLKGIINFLDEFTDSVAQDIRLDVFNCIKRLLMLSDYENTRDFIVKSLDKEVLPQRGDVDDEQIMLNLRQEAKIPYGFFFYNFFQVFKLQYTYEELIKSSQCAILENNQFICEIIRKYCCQDYSIIHNDDENYQECIITFEDSNIHEKIPDIDIHKQPLQFIGLLLHLINIMDFKLNHVQIYIHMVQTYLNQGEFNEIKDLLKQTLDYHVTNENINTKNYQILTDFKQQNDLETIFINFIMEWIQSMYAMMATVEQIDSCIENINQSLIVAQYINQHRPIIKKQKAFFQLIKIVKKFNVQLLTNIKNIQQMAQNTDFIFLMLLFDKIGINNFIILKTQDDTCFGKIYDFFIIFDKFKLYKGSEAIDSMKDPSFNQFMIEVCLIMISERKFTMAQTLLERTISSNYYYKDALYLFLICLDQSEITKTFQPFIKQIVQIQTNGIVKKKLKQFTHKNKLSQFYATRNYNKTMFEINCINLFKILLRLNRIDEAFYFMIRARQISNRLIEEIVKSNNRISNLSQYAYLSLVIYIKSLQVYLEKNFYPTFQFFKIKYQRLIDKFDNKDMIKDLYIAISRLKNIEEQANSEAKPKITKYREQLHQYYCKYMNLIGQNVILSLTDHDRKRNNRQIDNYSKNINRSQVENQEIFSTKHKIRENQDELNKISQDNKFNVVHREITQTVSQARKTAEKYEAILDEKTIYKNKNKEKLSEIKLQEIQQFKRNQREELSSIKDSFKSSTTERVNQLITNLRERRNAINQSRRIQSTQTEMNLMQPPRLRTQVTRFDGMSEIGSSQMRENNTNYNIQIHSPVSEKPKQLSTSTKHHGFGIMPVTIHSQRQINQPFLSNSKFNKSQQIMHSLKIGDFKSELNILNESNISGFSKNMKLNSWEQIKQTFEREQKQAYKYLEKIQMIKHNQNIGKQLLKRIYTVINNLSNFIDLLSCLMHYDSNFYQIIQFKSITIASQMLKMKQKISLKQLIPIDLFLNTCNMNIRDYYNFVYQMIRPNIRKILQQQEVGVHALGILLRYSLGSQTKFFHQVFIEYIRILLKKFQNKVLNEKQMYLLAEKLRTQYINLQAEDRNIKFQQLIHEMTNSQKKQQLIKTLKNIVQKRQQSAINCSYNQEFLRVIQKIK